MSGDTSASTMDLDHPITSEDNAIYDENGISDSDETATSDMIIFFDESTVSDEDESAASDTSVTPDEDLVPFMRTSLPSLISPILFSPEYTKRDLFLGKLATSINSNKTYEKTLLDFKLFNNFLVNGNFPTCKSSLW